MKWVKLKTYFRNLVRCFYDASLYREAITQWQGFGGRHILFVGAVLGTLITIALGIALYTFNTYDLPYIARQIPNIEIKNHVLNVKGPDPTLITTKDKTFRIVIDTKSPESILVKNDAEVVLGKKVVLLRQLDGFKPIMLDNSDDYVINRATIVDMFHKLYAFLILVWPLAGLGQALSMLGQVLLIALLSYAVTAAMREEYYFETRMRIAALAVTPPFIISKVSALFTDTTAQAPLTKTWFALLLALLYFYVMIMLIRRLPDEPTQA